MWPLLTDIGASGQAFVRKSLVRQYKMSLVPMEKPIQLADGSRGERITYMVQLNILLGEHREQWLCLGTGIPNHDIILGESLGCNSTALKSIIPTAP